MIRDGRPPGPDRLSDRELEVFELIGRQRTNAQIAEELDISFATAKWYVSQIIAKRGVSSREELVEEWRAEHGLRGRFRRFARALVGIHALKLTVGGAAVAVGATAVGVTLMVALPGDDHQRSTPDTDPVPTAIIVPTQPAPTRPAIDTSDPDWQLPLMAEWRAKVRMDQVVNGILVGPTVVVAPSVCLSGQRHGVPPEDALGTPMEIRPTYLPPGSTAVPVDLSDGYGSTIACDGEIVSNSALAGIPAASDSVERMAAGESWFTVPHGGRINVSKIKFGSGDTPSLRSDVPASHWSAINIGGLPAALGRPVVDEGLGTGEILVWNASSGVLTYLRFLHVSVDEMTRIAEGVKP